MTAGNVFSSLAKAGGGNTKKSLTDEYSGTLDNLAKQRDLILKTPTPESLEADQLEKEASGYESPFFKGFYEGKADARRRADFEKKRPQLEYLVQVANEAARLNMEHTRNIHAQEVAVPLLKQWNQMAPHLTPEQRVEAANQISTRLSQITGQPAPKVVDVGGSKFENWVLQDDQGRTLYINPLSELMPKGENDLDSFQRMAIEQQNFNNTIEVKKLGIDQQNANAHTVTAEAKKNKYAPPPTPELEEGELPLHSFPDEFRKDHADGVLKNFQKNPTNERAIQTVSEMSKILADHPDIGQSFIQLLDTKDNDWTPTKIVSILGQQYAQENSPGLLSAMQELRKLSSDLNLDVILSVPGKTATDVFKEEVKNAAPNGKLTKSAFDFVAQKWVKKAKSNIQKATQDLHNLKRGVINAKNQYEHKKIVKDPHTGEIRILTPQEAALVIAHGGVLVD